MASASPFGLDVYGPDFTWKQSISAPDGASFDPKLNDVGTGSITVPSDAAVNEYLAADGARITCTYNGGLLTSGPIIEDSGTFETVGGITYAMEDDYRVIRDALAWVVPGGNLVPTSLSDDAQAVAPTAHTAGTASGYGAFTFDAATRYAETAIKELIRKNVVQRLGIPLNIYPDLQRGGDAYTAGQLPVLRFVPISEGLASLLRWSGLRLMIWQDRLGSGLNLDVYAGTTWPQLLTVDSGIVVPTGATWSRTRATGSRAVIGGPGDGVARAYSSAVSASLEAATGQIREVFRDASSVPTNWDASVGTVYQVAKYFLQQSNTAADKAAYTAAMAAVAAQVLADGAAKSGLSLELAETPTFRFGGSSGIQIADPVNVSQHTTGTPVFADRISGASLSFDAQDGLVVQPLVGQKQDDPDEALAKAILGQARALRRIAASR